MRARVRFKLPDGSTAELGHGQIIGRLWSAALHLDDPRVSEAHALVSLRGERLKLLALRGRFAVADQPRTEAELTPGLVVELARGLALEVVSVTLPDDVLAIEGDGLPRLVLSGVCSLYVTPQRRLVPGYRPDAAATIWSARNGWSLRIAGEAPRAIQAGDSWKIGEHTFHAVPVAIANAGLGVTALQDAVAPPLNLVARYDSVHVHRPGLPSVSITGIAARILSELIACGVPMPWTALADEIWPDEDDRAALRRRLDVSLSRLRKKLRDARIRADLVRTDGSGNVEVFLHDTDTVRDET